MSSEQLQQHFSSTAQTQVPALSLSVYVLSSALAVRAGSRNLFSLDPLSAVSRSYYFKYLICRGLLLSSLSKVPLWANPDSQITASIAMLCDCMLHHALGQSSLFLRPLCFGFFSEDNLIRIFSKFFSKAGQRAGPK